jgi:branched-chain amino acid transport system substrate-binding protein
MKRQGLRIPVFGDGGIYAAALIQRGGDAVEGWVGTSAFWPQKPDPKVKKFVTDFGTQAGAAQLGSVSPDHFTAAMYSNIYITAKIIADKKITPKTALKDARNAIREGWESLKEYPAVDGATSMTPSGDVVKTPYVLYVKGGQFVAAGQ